MKNRSITVQGAEVAIATRHDQDYISLTDMVKSFEGGSALIEQWLKNKDTGLFLGVWEQINNSAFNSFEFEGIRNEAGRNSFYLSAKKWIDATGAIGLYAKAGRYGGTYAYRDIAFEFGSWLSPEFKLYLIKELQRLKDEEARAISLQWSFQRRRISRSACGRCGHPSQPHRQTSPGLPAQSLCAHRRGSAHRPR
jgi:hypothetical protein